MKAGDSSEVEQDHIVISMRGVKAGESRARSHCHLHEGVKAGDGSGISHCHLNEWR